MQPLRHRARFGALACLILALTGAHASAADDRARLVGAWRYAGEIDTHADGSRSTDSLAPDCEGLLLYTADGFMSVTIMPKNRRWSSETATIEELRSTVSDGTAYAGRYEVDPAAHTVTHRNVVNLEPDFAGKPLVRSYALSGDRLVLSGTFPWKGETIRFAITWERVAP